MSEQTYWVIKNPTEEFMLRTLSTSKEVTIEHFEDFGEDDWFRYVSCGYSLAEVKIVEI